ncbi:MAG: NADPH-dependent FMN reductase [Negativicutes bacterium]
MANKKIGVLVGSLRKESFNRKVAKELMAVAPEGLDLEEVAIGALPIFNQDFDDEGTTPTEWVAFRETLKQYDGFLFLTPEYNRSAPAVLKNALDIGSRPYGKNLWDNKPSAVVSVSIGGISGFGANHHLRQTLVFLNVPTMPQPEAYIGNAAALFDGDGVFASESTRQFLRKFMEAFAAWIERTGN